MIPVFRIKVGPYLTALASMILFYIDESGTSLNDPQNPYFVLAALAIPADSCRPLDAKLSALKRTMVSWAEPEDWEIKGRDMQRGQKFFKSVPWPARLVAIRDVARLIGELDARAYVVQVDKREIGRADMTDGDLYRIALFRLLDELDAALAQRGESGMLLLDSRSDQHSSVQDRRVLDAYLRWTASHAAHRLVERPWFGFSAFYAGLQLADFVAYMVDAVHNDAKRSRRVSELEAAIAGCATKLVLVRVP